MIKKQKPIQQKAILKIGDYDKEYFLSILVFKENQSISYATFPTK